MRDKEEKLLFMGASIGTEEAVSYAREQGVYTILTAQNAPENGEEKFGADEYWNIDLADLVSLEKKCRKEKVTAHADLAQLDAGVEDAGQILDQLTEVHAAVGGDQR